MSTAAATEVIKDGLLKLASLRTKTQTSNRTWFIARHVPLLDECSRRRQLRTRLEPGMVFIERTGIYIRPDALGESAEDS